MRKLIALAAIATMLTLAASPPASASYWHYGGRCRLTDDGSVFLGGFVSNSDGAYFAYGPVEWFYKMRELGTSTGWRRIDQGFRETVIVDPDGTWTAKFRSAPVPRAGFAYRLIAEFSFRAEVARYNDKRENPNCRPQAA